MNLINISLKFVPKGQIKNIPALVQKMAWRRSGDKPLSAPMMFSLLTHVCVIRPQWVKFKSLAFLLLTISTTRLFLSFVTTTHVLYYKYNADSLEDAILNERVFPIVNGWLPWSTDHTMDMLWEKFHWILPLYMKPINFQSKASVVCSVTTALFIDFCLKKLNVFSQHIGTKTNEYLDSTEKITRNWNVNLVSALITSWDIT